MGRSSGRAASRLDVDGGDVGLRTETEWVEHLRAVRMQCQSWMDDPDYLRPPDPDSSLAADDRPFAGYMTACVQSLVSQAMEHVMLGTGADSSGDGIAVYPSAQHTVVRGAVVAVSLALWMLTAHTRSQRQSRFVSFMLDDLAKERKMLNDSVTGMPGLDASTVAADQAKLDAREARWRDVAAKHGLSVGVPVNLTTDVIPKAFAAAFSSGGSGFPFIVPLWRMTSSAAHGSFSHIFRQLIQTGEKVADSDGGGLYRYTGSFDEVGPLIDGSMVLLARASWWYNERSASPFSGLRRD